MSEWHYAIGKDKYGHHYIIEVYDNGSWTEPIEPMGETVNELLRDLQAMLEDAKYYPVIDMETGESYGNVRRSKR